MLRLLAQAHRYRVMMLEAQGRTMRYVAREAGVELPCFCRNVIDILVRAAIPVKE